MSTIYWIHYPEHTNPYTEGYVGVSANPTRRFKEHSKSSKSINRMVSGAIAKGAIQTIISVCDTLEEALLLESRYRPTELIGWNIIPGGGIPPSQTGKKRSPETKNRLKESHIGKTIPPEVIAKRAAVLRGRKTSEETKRKIGNSNRGKVRSEETRKLLSESHRGILPSVESRKKKSETCKNSPYAKSISRKIKTPYGVFNSIRDCSRQTGIGTSAIRYRLKGPDPEWCDYFL